VTVPAFTATDRNRRLSDESFGYQRCRQCHTLELSPVPEDLSRYYPAEYYSLPQTRAEFAITAAPERYKLDLLRPVAPGGRLVEIGPAIGGFAVHADAAGYEVSAIEMDPHCCRFLREVVGIEVFETADPVPALREHGPFDVIAMWQVLEHLPDPRQVLEAAAAALSRGGVLAIAAPNPQALQFRCFGARWTHVDAPRHLTLIPSLTLVSIGEELGLEVALLTTIDIGTLGWNYFGWRESLAGFGRGEGVRAALRFAGSALTRVMAPAERRGGLGSTYTLLLRRPR
jgi:2-polyprenyl-3-methyl-5-hydroxy-6-metoxy-1,4-benzoquinol methylase